MVRAQPRVLLTACLLWQASGAGVTALLLEVPWGWCGFPGVSCHLIIPKITEAVCVARVVCPGRCDG